MSLKMLRLTALVLSVLVVLVAALSVVARTTARHVRASLAEQQRALHAAFMHVHARAVVDGIQKEGLHPETPAPVTERVHESLSGCRFAEAYDFPRAPFTYDDAELVANAFTYRLVANDPRLQVWGPREREFHAEVDRRASTRAPSYYDGMVRARVFLVDRQSQQRSIEEAALAIACDVQQQR